MGASTQSASSKESATPFESFADMVDYSGMYADLRNHGIELTQDEKKRCEGICGDRLRNHDGGQVIGNSFGGTIVNFVYTLVAFFKNMFGGSFTSIGDMASNVGATITSTGEQSKLWQLQQAEAETYLRLKNAGGNLANAAEYITGVKPLHDNSPGQILETSILNQVGKSINLPVDTNTSLNNWQPTAVASASVPTGLPAKLSTQALTPRG